MSTFRRSTFYEAVRFSMGLALAERVAGHPMSAGDDAMTAAEGAAILAEVLAGPGASDIPIAAVEWTRIDGLGKRLLMRPDDLPAENSPGQTLGELFQNDLGVGLGQRQELTPRETRLFVRRGAASAGVTALFTIHDGATVVAYHYGQAETSAPLAEYLSNAVRHIGEIIAGWPSKAETFEPATGEPAAMQAGLH